jgi:hypothetical protein
MPENGKKSQPILISARPIGIFFGDLTQLTENGSASPSLLQARIPFNRPDIEKQACSLGFSAYYLVIGGTLRFATQLRKTYALRRASNGDLGVFPFSRTIQMFFAAFAIASGIFVTPQIFGAEAPGIQTVFLIVFENKDWADIKGNSSAPYINNSILPMASYCEQYFNPPNLHPSLRNYIWLEAGSSLGIPDNRSPFFNHQSTTNHLVTLLNAAGISWRSYQEGIPGTDCPVHTIPEALYDPHHNPTVYFDDIISNAAYCITHNRPYAELDRDLRNDAVARYNFITPNLCNDGHQPCAPINSKIGQLDRWLSEAIPTILRSQAYQSGGAIFITFDEGSLSDGPIPMIVLSPLAKGNGFSNTIHYTHSSMLRTLQTIFGVTPFLRDAANAVDLSDLFVDGAFTSSPADKASPVGAWEVTLGGSDKGVAFLTFSRNHTYDGYGMRRDACGLFTVSGDWDLDTQGQVIGSYTEHPLDGTSCSFPSIDGTFIAKVSARGKLRGSINDTTGGLRLRGGHLILTEVPAMGAWLAEVRTRNGASTETWTLNPNADLPNAFDISGQEISGAYTVSGQAIIEVGGTMTAYTTRRHGRNNLVSSSFSGNYRSRRGLFSFSLRGTDESGNRLRIQGSKQ